MVTKKFQDLTLSALGMGTMRLPVFGKDDARIDEDRASEMVSYAIKQGINYFDTAWGYHSGNSETVMGRILSQYPRDSFYLATKFPGYDLSNMGKVEEIFEKQLKKCQMEYFDFYLFHNVCEMNIDAYLDGKYGIFDYLMKQKENGRIRHLGFSIHGNMDVMRRFLDAYGEYMEFCQIQLNYIDWSFQDAKAKVDLLNERQIPIWVMEPLRGGKLADLPEPAAQRVKALRPDGGIPEMAFRFLQAVPGVTMVLSGMSDYEQLKDNIKTFETDSPLSAEEMEKLLAVADGMLNGVLACTACHYCVSHCPKGLDIPALLKLYNEHSFTGGGFIAPMALKAVPEEKHPSACIACRSCEAVCPQQLKISEAMKDFAAKLSQNDDK
ncbi:oxidoreductase [bacterium 1xD8-6]|nr:oxidoreductase [bacterium D16-36]RKI68290.1 oxidoreductase [bacterium 1xD8-6]